MTEMKRFITKKDVTKMKLMKSKATHLRLSSDGALSMAEFESTALNMISGQVSIVETSKKVDIEEKIVL